LLLEIVRLNAPSTRLTDRLIALVQQLLGNTMRIPEPFPLHSQLSTVGLSSLKMVNLMLMIEMEFDLTIPQADITPENFDCLASIERLVARLLATRTTV
jgi:acyl carrier protein